MVRAARPTTRQWPILGSIFRNRALVVISGYVIASLAVSITIQVESLLSTLMQTKPLNARVQPSDLAMTTVMSLVVAHVALVPALGFMIYGEFARVRSLPFYAGAGVFTGLCIFLFCGLVGLLGHASGSLLTNFLILFLVPGLAAGIVYWGVAGRTAGVRVD